jgi:hypothetical protein
MKFIITSLIISFLISFAITREFKDKNGDVINFKKKFMTYKSTTTNLKKYPNYNAETQECAIYYEEYINDQNKQNKKFYITDVEIDLFEEKRQIIVYVDVIKKNSFMGFHYGKRFSKEKQIIIAAEGKLDRILSLPNLLLKYKVPAARQITIFNKPKNIIVIVNENHIVFNGFECDEIINKFDPDCIKSPQFPTKSIFTILIEHVVGMRYTSDANGHYLFIQLKNNEAQKDYSVGPIIDPNFENNMKTILNYMPRFNTNDAKDIKRGKKLK